MPNPKLQAKIKIAQKQLGLEDSVYRDILYRKFRISSSKSLSDSQANVLIHYFKSLGWIPKSKPKKYDDQKGDIYSASPGQKRLIEILWHNIYRGNEETQHLREFLFNHFKISDIRFLDKDKANQAIEALKIMASRQSV
jgi:hypothetical protein